MRMTLTALTTLALAIGCGRAAEPPTQRAAEPAAGSTFTVAETTIVATFDAAGVAEPIQRATLSTRLMGSVTEVLVREGDRVRAGELLARIDAREVEAKRAQVEAGIAAAEAVYQDARTQAERFRALYADSAATRYQLDQVETGLARAEAGLQTARASRAELDAVGAYAEIRAPFTGIVTRRFVDPGAFAAPGSPDRRGPGCLAPPGQRLGSSAGGCRPPAGAALDASIEGRPVPAIVEGVVPGSAGAVYTVNAIVENPRNELPPGSAATLRVPQGRRVTVIIPAGAVVREGDLTGVRVKTERTASCAG